MIRNAQNYQCFTRLGNCIHFSHQLLLIHDIFRAFCHLYRVAKSNKLQKCNNGRCIERFLTSGLKRHPSGPKKWSTTVTEMTSRHPHPVSCERKHGFNSYVVVLSRTGSEVASCRWHVSCGGRVEGWTLLRLHDGKLHRAPPPVASRQLLRNVRPPPPLRRFKTPKNNNTFS